MANTDLSQAATPVSFDDDLLGTNAMAQATEMAPAMPEMAAPPPPEVTMTADDLTPSFTPEEPHNTGFVPPDIVAHEAPPADDFAAPPPADTTPDDDDQN